MPSGITICTSFLHPQKVSGWIAVILSGKLTVCNCSQSRKTADPRQAHFSGTLASVSFLQPQNALSPIYLKEVEYENAVMPLQFMNAEMPIDDTADAERSTEVSPVQPENACLPIEITFDPTDKEVILSLSSKAPSLMTVTG